MKSMYGGNKWVEEILNDPLQCFHNIFKMFPQTFIYLLAVFTTSHDFYGSTKKIIGEVLAMNLYILAKNESIRATCDRFQQFSETVIRYFDVG